MSLQAVKKPSYNNTGHRVPLVFLHEVYQFAARAQVFICSAVIFCCTVNSLSYYSLACNLPQRYFIKFDEYHGS